MTPAEVARAAVDVVGVLVEVVRAIEAATRGEDPARVREILSGDLATTMERHHAELRAALHFATTEAHDDD